MKQLYVDGITLPQILEDGWCRGFEADQTVSEAEYMGFLIPEEEVIQHWKLLDKEFNEAMEKERMKTL